MRRTVFNNVHEPVFNPNKVTKYYGFLTEKDDTTGKLVIHECKFRGEAKDFFNSVAKSNGLKFDGKVFAF